MDGGTGCLGVASKPRTSDPGASPSPETLAASTRGRRAMSVGTREPWPLCFAGEGDDGTPLAEVWCLSWPGTGNLDYSVVVVGELSERTAPLISPALGSLPDGSRVALDLRDITSMDSSGLVVLDETIARYTNSGGLCTITAISRAVLDRIRKTSDPYPPDQAR